MRHLLFFDFPEISKSAFRYKRNEDQAKNLINFINQRRIECYSFNFSKKLLIKLAIL